MSQDAQAETTPPANLKTHISFVMFSDAEREAIKRLLIPSDSDSVIGDYAMAKDVLRHLIDNSVVYSADPK